MKKDSDCHPGKPARARGLCNTCYARQFRPKYNKVRRNALKEWREKNPEQAYRMEANRHLKRKFGITFDVYEKMKDEQGGLCKLCKNPENTRNRGSREQRFAVDHCHLTNKIRGLLCFKCNTGLAWIESNPGIINGIIGYLRRTPE